MISPSHNIDTKTAFSEEINTSFEPLFAFGKIKQIMKDDFIIIEGEKCDASKSKTNIYTYDKGLKWFPFVNVGVRFNLSKSAEK